MTKRDEYRVNLRRHDGQSTHTTVTAVDEEGARREVRYYHPELRVTSVERAPRRVLPLRGALGWA